MSLKLSNACIKLLAGVAILPFAALPSVTHAQSQGEEQHDGGGEGPGGGDQFIIGVGGMFAPRYLGSDEYKFQPLPLADVKWGRLFINFQDGIGANLIDSDAVTIGAGVVMADGYSVKDAPAGVGKLSTGVGARGFIKVRQAGFEAVLGGTKIISGSTEGVIADASLSYPIMISEKLFLMPSVGTSWGNRKHNNRYFGINAAQSSASGLPQFSTGSGLIDAKAEIAAQYRVTDRISVGLTAGVTTLLGDIQDSPIVKSKTRPFGIAFIGYSF